MSRTKTEANQFYGQAVALVATSRVCSVHGIQRKLAIGFNRAARIVDRMEKEGLVSQPNHVGKRMVLIDQDGLITRNVDAVDEEDVDIDETFEIEGMYGWTEVAAGDTFHYFVENPEAWSPKCVGIPLFGEQADDGSHIVHVCITHKVCPGCSGAGGWMYAPGNCDAYEDCETCGGETKVPVAN